MPDELQRTPLYDRHAELGARMVPFAGWSMPVQYRGVIEEHAPCARGAGVFDVSHMGRFAVRGAHAHDDLQGAAVERSRRLAPARRSTRCSRTSRGGIVDDLIAYRHEPAATCSWSTRRTARAISSTCSRACPADATLVDESDETAMLAVQGPAALALIGRLSRGSFEPLRARVHFGDARSPGVPCIVARTGYTGEDGVELICRRTSGGALGRAARRGPCPCGLGARDTLRLEVCYPLHGNDIGPDTNAIEAGLGWVCALDKEFIGSDALRRTRAARPRTAPRRLCACSRRAIPRAGCEILDPEGASRPRHERDDVAEPRRGHRHGLRAAPRCRARQCNRRSTCADAATAEVARKPLYRKET